MKSLKQYIKEHLLVENFGEFKYAKEVTAKIINSIKENEGKTKIKIDVSEFELPYNFVNLQINKVNYKELVAYYISNLSDFNYKEIYLEIKFNEINNALNKIIVHELTHANCDFNLHKIGKSINSLLSSKHFKNENENIIAYRKSFKLNNKSITDDILYFLNSSERNAYLSRLKSDVFDVLDKHKIDVRSSDGYEKLIKEIKNIPTINKIFEIGSFIEQIDNLSDDNKKSITSKFNNLHRNSSNWTTYKNVNSNNIIKDIKEMWNKFLKKFKEYVPKICAEYYESIK